MSAKEANAYIKPNGGICFSAHVTFAMPNGVSLEFDARWIDIWGMKNFLPAHMPDPAWLEFKGVSEKSDAPVFKIDGIEVPHQVALQKMLGTAATLPDAKAVLKLD